MTEQRNKGEGNETAVREFNREQERFAKGGKAKRQRAMQSMRWIPRRAGTCAKRNARASATRTARIPC